LVRFRAKNEGNNSKKSAKIHGICMKCTWKNGKNMESMQKNMDSMKNSWNFPMPVFHANSNGVLKTEKIPFSNAKKQHCWVCLWKKYTPMF